jgi:hypothetical protein
LTSIQKDGYIQKLSTTPVGLAQVADPEIVVYPNPSQGHLAIRFDPTFGPARLEVLDMTGRIQSTHSTETGSVRIELPHAKGVYLIRLVTDDYRIKRRVVRL